MIWIGLKFLMIILQKLFNYVYKDKKLSIVARNLKYGDKYGFVDFYELKKIRAKNKKKRETTS